MFYYVLMEKISSFSKRLKILMDIRGVSVANMVEDLDITKSLMSKYLSGKVEPRQDRFDQIARYFNVSHGWLMGYDCEMYSSDIKSQILKHIETLDTDQLMSLYDFIKKLIEEKNNG